MQANGATNGRARLVLLFGLALGGAGLVMGAGACKSGDGKLRVTGIEPRTGDSMGGQFVVISGGAFTKATRTAKIYFGDQQGRFIRFRSDSEMIAEAPGGKPDTTVDVLVVFEPGGEITIPKGYTFKEKRGINPDDLDRK
ncbi:MAG: IPT/TIG domain-containing protein [Kofleriaceae bacterium]